jgi:hypothetical protein
MSRLAATVYGVVINLGHDEDRMGRTNREVGWRLEEIAQVLALEERRPTRRGHHPGIPLGGRWG